MRKSHLLALAGVFFSTSSVFVGCKPAQQMQAAITAADIETANSEMSRRMDEGLAQLNLELDALDAAQMSTSESNMNLSAGALPSLGAFKSLFTKVNGLWKNFQGNPCRLWSPLVRAVGRDLARPYFFVGASAEAGAGVHGMIGRDYVWDFYNLQVAVFNYKALEFVFGSGTVGAGVNTYAGIGFGNKLDVNDAWSGRFASTGFSGSLPVLAEYLSGHIGYFSSQNTRGQADLRFKGGSIGLSASVSVPTTLPGALQVASGNWTIDKVENQKVSRALTRLGIKNSMQGNDTCQGQCVRIDNIKAGMGYTGRAVNLVRSIPFLGGAGTGIGMIVGIEKIMLLALATGAYRDTLNNHAVCR